MYNVHYSIATVVYPMVTMSHDSESGEISTNDRAPKRNQSEQTHAEGIHSSPK